MDPYPIPVRNISIFVTTLHILLLGALLWVAPSNEIKPKSKQLVVQTIQLTPKKTGSIQNTSTVKDRPPVSSPSKPKAPPPPPKVEKKVESVKPAVKEPPKPPAKSAPKPSSTPAQKTTAQTPPKTPTKETEKASTPAPKKGPSQESLAAVRQKLAAMPTTALAMGPAISGEVSSGAASLSYEEELSARLKILLKLPEMGDVRVALTLNRQGVVTKLEILSSVSMLNKKAVETHLPPIQFPSFGKAYPGETTHTFTLTLTNL